MELDIIFNENKSVCIVFRTNRDRNYKFEPLWLNSKALKYCNSFKYLGHISNNDLQDNDVIMRQTSAIYARGNKLVNSIKHYTEDVTCKHFKTYISSFYTLQC